MAQGEPVQNPSASGLTRSVDYPVDNSTGLPDISIPLYSMPTRSKDIAINVSLSYHPSAVASYNEHMGDCGRGWTIIKGGAITWQAFAPCDIVWKHEKKRNTDYNNTRSVDEPERPLVYTTAPSDVFTFNFMGFSGKFKLKRIGNIVNAEFIENKGNILKISVDFDYVNNDIKSFTIYDDKGYKYKFTIADTYIVTMPNLTFTIPAHVLTPSRYTGKSALHLKYIIDNNDVILAEFSYRKFDEYISGFHEGNERNFAYINDKIQSPGIGTLEFASVPSGTLNSINSFRFTGLNIKDINLNPIRNFSFVVNNDKLIRISESGQQGNNAQAYTFEYQMLIAGSYQLMPGYDKWGYPNTAPEQCSLRDLATNYGINGVLNKIVTPTGGCTIYNYEPNTYSYISHEIIPLAANTDYNDLSKDPEIFYTYFKLPQNKHNFEFQECIITFSNTIHSGTCNLGPGDKYFRFHGNSTSAPVLEGGGSATVYPTFTVSGSLSKTFTIQDNYFNSENNCNGFKHSSNSGSYTISTGSNSTGNVTVIKPILKPAEEIKKWWYGGGIRIKNIQYFIDENTATLYKNNPDFQENYKPVRQVNYDYTLFNDASTSSGSLLNTRYYAPSLINPLKDFKNVIYKNVTITEEGKGKTQYTYHAPVDFVDESGSYLKNNDYRLGQLKNKKVFDNAGNPLQETSFYYLFDDYESIYNPLDPTLIGSDNLGWIALRQVKNKTFYPEGAIETTDEYTYNGFRKLASHSSLTSRSSEVLMTEYSYHTGNAEGSQNRNELSETRNYRNNELLSKSVINYSNQYNTDNYGGTVSLNSPYFPSSIASSKGSSVLEQKLKFNVYDVFGHLLESEQENGSKTAYIYGYNESQVIAKIENSIAYDAIPITLINEAKAASDGNDEALLLTKLTALRSHASLANAFVTTYTHKRLIGVSTLTDARGYKTSYEYDSFGRLKAVKDADGNTLTETEYNLIQQPQN